MENRILTPFSGRAETLPFDLQKFASTYEISSFEQLDSSYRYSTLKAGDTVKLTANIKVPDPVWKDDPFDEEEPGVWYEKCIMIVNIPNLTLDLNGYSITGKNNDHSELLDVRNSVLTITDTSASKTGSIMAVSLLLELSMFH